MARNRGDEDVRTDPKRTGNAAAHSADNRGGKYRVTAMGAAAADDRTSAGCAALSNLLLRDDGWLRAIPDRDGKTAFLKWKFSHGRFAGSYVMVVISPSAWANGFELLEQKIDRCYAGTHKPTKDRDYLPIFDEDMPR